MNGSDVTFLNCTLSCTSDLLCNEGCGLDLFCSDDPDCLEVIILPPKKLTLEQRILIATISFLCIYFLYLVARQVKDVLQKVDFPSKEHSKTNLVAGFGKSSGTLDFHQSSSLNCTHAHLGQRNLPFESDLKIPIVSPEDIESSSTGVDENRPAFSSKFGKLNYNAFGSSLSEFRRFARKSKRDDVRF